jgi:hypothetical protein
VSMTQSAHRILSTQLDAGHPALVTLRRRAEHGVPRCARLVAVCGAACRDRVIGLSSQGCWNLFLPGRSHASVGLNPMRSKVFWFARDAGCLSPCQNLTNPHPIGVIGRESASESRPLNPCKYSMKSRKLCHEWFVSTPRLNERGLEPAPERNRKTAWQGVPAPAFGDDSATDFSRARHGWNGIAAQRGIWHSEVP